MYGEKEVAVLVCGPGPMARDARRLAMAVSSCIAELFLILQGSSYRPNLHPFNFRPPFAYSHVVSRPQNPIYTEMYGEKEVAVLVCGPGPMARDARRLAMSMSGDGVQFRFHAEVFEF